MTVKPKISGFDPELRQSEEVVALCTQECPKLKTLFGQCKNKTASSFAASIIMMMLSYNIIFCCQICEHTYRFWHPPGFLRFAPGCWLQVGAHRASSAAIVAVSLGCFKSASRHFLLFLQYSPIPPRGCGHDMHSITKDGYLLSLINLYSFRRT